jgi:hypothetical protein
MSERNHELRKDILICDFCNMIIPTTGALREEHYYNEAAGFKAYIICQMCFDFLVDALRS